MDRLYIDIFLDRYNETFISIESFLVLYIYTYLKSTNVQVILVQACFDSTNRLLKINVKNLKYDIIKYDSNNHEISDLKLPLYVKGNSFIAGLCAVCREIVMQTEEPNNRIDLLGFKGSCLLAPTETSVWTKFCEIDITQTVNEILNYNFDQIESESFCISDVLTRFEGHLKQPIRVHNVYKLARDEAKKLKKPEPQIFKMPQERIEPKVPRKNKHKNNKNKIQIESGVPIDQLNLEHKFAEGCKISLADVILYPSFGVLFRQFPNVSELRKLIPLTWTWFEAMEGYDKDFPKTFNDLLNVNWITSKTQKLISYTIRDIKNYSLYKSDPKRYKPRDRLFTRQDDINESLNLFKELGVNATSQTPNELSNQFDWSSIPLAAHPECGELPEKRILRKKHQLENLAKAIIKIAQNNDRIVDFCCGSGHLGIILAQQLPNCHIIFLENKALSLNRAKERIQSMNLKNCSFYQSNIDYMQGKFDIGTSLHACGTATDIVLKQCIDNKAKFVCCPCCYGFINPMPHISYPLSRKYKSGISIKNYLYIAHAADQAHDASSANCNVEKSSQGQLCMDIIDMDRKLLAEEFGYKVILTRLQPEDCTPKNRLLLGVI